MKYKLSLIATAIVLAFAPALFIAPLAMTGCVSTTTISTNSTGGTVTNTTSSLDPLASSGISMIASGGARVAAAQDANSVAYLRLVANVFTAAGNSGQYDPASVKAALDTISIKEIRGSPGDMVANGLFAAYQGFFANAATTAIDDSVKGPWLRDILLATGTGISAGLPTLPPQ